MINLSPTSNCRQNQLFISSQEKDINLALRFLNDFEQGIGCIYVHPIRTADNENLPTAFQATLREISDQLPNSVCFDNVISWSHHRYIRKIFCCNQTTRTTGLTRPDALLILTKKTLGQDLGHFKTAKSSGKQVGMTKPPLFQNMLKLLKQAGLALL